MALVSITITYNQTMLEGTRNGIRKTRTARSISAMIIIFLRSNLSTNTPATNPTNKLGAAVAININPTLNADPPVWR
jgi:hypothetical protein